MKKGILTGGLVKLYRETILLLSALLFILAAPCARAQQSVLRQQDRQAIEQLHQKEIEANIALDVPALASLWTDDIVSLPPDGPPVVGREANLSYLESSAKKMADYNILSYTQDWQQVFQLDPEYAFEWGFISGRLQPPAGGQEIEYRYKALRILKRQGDGTWKIHRTSWSEALSKERQSPESGRDSPRQQ
jgi:uncharacterized protein (TIGR02246 family)